MIPRDHITQLLMGLSVDPIAARNIATTGGVNYLRPKHQPSVHGVRDLSTEHNATVEAVAAQLRKIPSYTRDPLRHDTDRSTRHAADIILTALKHRTTTEANA